MRHSAEQSTEVKTQLHVGCKVDVEKKDDLCLQCCSRILALPYANTKVAPLHAWRSARQVKALL
jgi:hypothetical protein